MVRFLLVLSLLLVSCTEDISVRRKAYVARMSEKFCSCCDSKVVRYSLNDSYWNAECENGSSIGNATYSYDIECKK